MREGFPWLVHPRAGSCGRQTQTTNLGVSGSNPFGRAIKSMLLTKRRANRTVIARDQSEQGPLGKDARGWLSSWSS